MARFFRPAKLVEGGVWDITPEVYDAAETFLIGAVLIRASDGEVVEAADNPTVGIIGVSLQGVGTAPGYEVANDSQVLVKTGVARKVSVVSARSPGYFSGRGVNGGTDPVVPLQTHIGEQYALTTDGDGYWVIDFADAVNVAVEITGIVDALGNSDGFHLFKFIDTAIATSL